MVRYEKDESASLSDIMYAEEGRQHFPQSVMLPCEAARTEARKAAGFMCLRGSTGLARPPQMAIKGGPTFLPY